MPRTVSNLPGPVSTWIMGALARGHRVYYFTDDPSGYIDSVPATDHLGRPVINEGEGNAGQRMYRYVTKAETLPLYRITLQSLELPEKNNLYIFASAVEPGIVYPSDRGMGEWSDGVVLDGAFYATPTDKYRRVCVTPDNQVFPQGRITGFSSGQDKAILAAVAVAAGGFWAYGGGGAAAGASGAGAATGAAGAEAAAGASVAEAAAGAGFVGPMAPEVVGGAGAGAGITMSGVAKGAAAVAGAVTQTAVAITQVSAALNNSGGGNTEPPPDPPADNTIYWLVGGTILVIGVIL